MRIRIVVAVALAATLGLGCSEPEPRPATIPPAPKTAEPSPTQGSTNGGIVIKGKPQNRDVAPGVDTRSPEERDRIAKLEASAKGPPANHGDSVSSRPAASSTATGSNSDATKRRIVERLAAGKFDKPSRTTGATTYLYVQSPPGEFIGQGETISFSKAGDVTLEGDWLGCIQVHAGDWTLAFAAPEKKNLAPGDYADAKYAPSTDKSPGVSFSGLGRSGEVSGHFVVWELEAKDGKAVRFAVDFVMTSAVDGPPICGLVRFNSTFE
jgi:hypothetical protein